MGRRRYAFTSTLSPSVYTLHSLSLSAPSVIRPIIEMDAKYERFQLNHEAMNGMLAHSAPHCLQSAMLLNPRSMTMTMTIPSSLPSTQRPAAADRLRRSKWPIISGRCWR